MAVNFWKVPLFFSITLFLSSIGSAQSQTLTFQPKADYSTTNAISFGLRPYAVAVGDLNGDTWPDIVTVNSNNNNISVFINNQNGTFAPCVNYSIGNTPRSLVLADFNGDGKLDVAVGNYAASTVAVRLGNGDGTFQPTTAYSVGGQPNALVVGDINNDGLPDLVAAGGAGMMSVLLNTGSGVFQVLSPVPTENTTGLVLADFDGDGKLDIASCSSAAASERITVRYGQGDGMFGSAANFALPAGGALAIRAATVDGDTNLDLLTANLGNGNGGSYSYRKGDGAGNFTMGSDQSLGLIPVALEVADLNGDGFRDTIFANSAQNAVVIIVGKGDGTFQPPQDFTVGSQPYGVAIGDFNKDGKPDIVTANFATNSISVLINTTPVTARTLSGRILLEANTSSAVPITFTFHPEDGSPIFTRILTPTENGDYTLSNIAPKIYTVGIKGSKWLRASMTADALAGNIIGFNATLLGGDGNDDNTVDINDLLVLIAHYNQAQGSGDYLDAVDFNSDGFCDIADLTLLISHYNSMGSP